MTSVTAGVATGSAGTYGCLPFQFNRARQGVAHAAGRRPDVDRYYALSKAQLAHMRMMSDAILASTPQRGPYAKAPKAPPVPPKPIAPAVEESEGDLPPLEPPPRHAKDYLRRRLSGRVEVPSAALFKDAATYGFSPKMLRTAKNALKIRVFQQDRAWWWLLTEDR
jgi:hypothetical protein